MVRRLARGAALAVSAAVALGGCGSSPSSTAKSASTNPPPATGVVPSSPGSTTTSPGRPPLVSDCGGSAYEPTTLYVTCGQAKLTATEIHWVSWSRSQAQGSAVMSVLACQPSCAQGHEQLIRAHLSLMAPKPTAHGPEFSSLTITWSGPSPDGKPVETYPLATD